MTESTGVTSAPSRDGIDRLQEVMATMPQLPLQTRHYFADGMYCRELLIPKGCTLVGKVHRREHFCFLTQGAITIISDGERKHINAPAIFVSAPGVKRAGYAHEDCIFVNVHRTASVDLAEIESELIEEDRTALFDAHNELKPLLENPQ